ncbi:hypothetical protein ACHAQA_005670 [Verticillium albo-atrum]
MLTTTASSASARARLLQSASSPSSPRTFGRLGASLLQRGQARHYLAGRATSKDHTSPVNSYSPIDPITNRRLPTYTERNTILAKALKASFLRTPVHSDGPPSAQELRKYRKVEIDDRPWITVQFEPAEYSDLNKYKPVLDSASPAKAPPAPKYNDLHKYAPVVDQVDTTHDAEPKYNDLHKYGPVDVHTSDSSPLPGLEGAERYHDLDKYGPVTWREPSGKTPPSAEEASKQYSDLDKYRPIQFNEPNGNLPPTAEELSKQYTDLDKYRPVQFNEPNGKLPLTPEELSKQYTDLDKYGPVKFNEPDGNLPPSSEELSKQYADLDKYRPVLFNEPNGKLPPTSEELSKQYDDLHKYGPVYWNEPDGKLQLSAEEKSKFYTDLNSYGPVMWNEPDGKLPPTAEEKSKQYDDLNAYRPVLWNEPNGQLPPTSEERSKRYTDLHSYEPVMWNEPNGKLPISAEERSKNYDDLDNYGPVQWNEPDGNLPPTSEELSKQYADLEKYQPVQWNEPNGQQPIGAEEASKHYDDLNTYKPIRWNEPDGKPVMSSEEASKQYDDLEQYDRPFAHNEPDGKPAITPEEASKQYDDLDKYQPVRWNEPDGQPPIDPEEASKQYKDLSDYSEPFKHNEPDGKPPVQQNKTTLTDDLATYGAFRYNEPDGRAEDLDAQRARSSHTASLERDSSRYRQDWENATRAAKTTLKQSKIKSQKQSEPSSNLTGNYARDFPEESAVSWSALLGQNAAATQYQNKLENSTQEPEKGDEEIASFDESFPKLETALDRQATSFTRGFAKIEPSLNRGTSFLDSQKRADRLQTLADPYSTEPQGLELSYLQECGGKPTGPTFVRTYGTVSDAASAAATQAKAASAAPEPAKEAVPEPSYYKILAYDATTKSISTAETSSLAIDSSTPLTPPEAMMRLSNPAKFFPHLAPLQAQGYEIVSGNGDVLVFRKVRDAEIEPARSSTTTEKATRYQPPRVNPIDMMGSQPVTPHSYSASPTGFVNYDDASAEVDQKPPPPYRATFGTQGAGPAASGFAADEEPKKAGKAKKMLLGAAWVGGISYAFGTVGQYFRTGGTDGKGSSGRF